MRLIFPAGSTCNVHVRRSLLQDRANWVDERKSSGPSSAPLETCATTGTPLIKMARHLAAFQNSATSGAKHCRSGPNSSRQLRSTPTRTRLMDLNDMTGEHSDLAIKMLPSPDTDDFA